MIRRGRVWLAAASIVLGVVTAWAVAWTLVVFEDRCIQRSGFVRIEARLIPPHRRPLGDDWIGVESSQDRSQTNVTVTPGWTWSTGFAVPFTTAFPAIDEMPADQRLPWHPNYAIPRWVRMPARDSSYRWIQTTAWGWPARCLAQWDWYPHDSPGRDLIVNGCSFNPNVLHVGTGWPWLPIRPLWGGMAIDGALYGAAWWGLISGVAWERRRRRGAGNRCGSCGYDLRGLPAGAPCPECGRPHKPA